MPACRARCRRTTRHRRGSPRTPCLLRPRPLQPDEEPAREHERSDPPQRHEEVAVAGRRVEREIREQVVRDQHEEQVARRQHDGRQDHCSEPGGLHTPVPSCVRCTPRSAEGPGGWGPFSPPQRARRIMSHAAHAMPHRVGRNPTDADRFSHVRGHPVFGGILAANAAMVAAFVSAFDRVLTIDRMVNSATITTTWKPRIMRFASTAGRQPISPSLITKTPNGLVFVANPVPVPPSPPGA